MLLPHVDQYRGEEETEIEMISRCGFVIHPGIWAHSVAWHFWDAYVLCFVSGGHGIRRESLRITILLRVIDRSPD